MAHGKSLQLGPVSRLMGILNVTPDSFSDGGRFLGTDKAIDHAAAMIRQGADIIDVGGETTKPGAQPIDQDIELERVLPIIDVLAKRFDTIISIDTYRPDTARLALEAGAHLVNDIRGFQFDENMAVIVSQFEAGICLMHNSRNRVVADDLIDDQIEYLCRSISIARRNNISENRIVIDPGFGFGKDTGDNLDLMNRFAELNAIGFPVLAGTSRKRFTGFVLGEMDDTDRARDIVTSATSVIARMAGSAVFRVHDVETNRAALNMADAVLARRRIG